MATTTKMEALKAELDKTLRDYMEYAFSTETNGNKPLTSVENEHFNALILAIKNIIDFYQVLSDENVQLTMSNVGLKAACDRLVHGIRQIHVNEKEEDGELQAANVQMKQENDEMKAQVKELTKKVFDLVQTCELKEAEMKTLGQKLKKLEGHASAYQTAASELFPQESPLQKQQGSAVESLGTELKEKDKTIASLEDENRQLKAENVQREKNILLFQKIIDDQSKQIEKLENPGRVNVFNSQKPSNVNVVTSPRENPNKSDVVSSPPSGNPAHYILLKDALNGTELSLNLVQRKTIIVQRLLSTNDNMILNAYSTFDDVNEKPVQINIKYATFKFHLNGSLSIHRRISPFLFSMLDSCSLIDVRLYYITINYSHFMKLVSSGTVKTLYLISAVIKGENGQDMPLEEIVREVSNVEQLSFVFPRHTQVTANTFAQLPHFPKLKKLTFGNIPERIDESVIFAFEKKYPRAICYHTYATSSNPDRSFN